MCTHNVRMGMRKEKTQHRKLHPNQIPGEAWKCRQKDGQKDLFSPRDSQTTRFPYISTKFSVYIHMHSGVPEKSMGKEFHPFLPYFLTAVHCTASIFLSCCSESSILLQTHLFLCILLSTKELIILKSLIMKELCSRRLENKANFSMAQF